MSEETATLRDASAPADAPVETAKTEPETTTATTIATAVANADAAEIGQLLMDSGVTKEQVNDLLQAPKALAAIRHMIVNNQNEFLATVERNDPQAFEKLMETAAEKYVERHGSKEPKSNGKGDSELMQQVELLKTKLGEFETREQLRERNAAMAYTKNRYDARVDDLFGQIPKDLELTKVQTKNLRARLDQELASDPEAVKRINSGNFVDVPRKFQSLAQELADDKKQAAEAAKAKRDRSARSAFPEYPSGPNPVMLDIPKDAADSWDNTESFLANLLDRSGS